MVFKNKNIFKDIGIAVTSYLCMKQKKLKSMNITKVIHFYQPYKYLEYAVYPKLCKHYTYIYKL